MTDKIECAADAGKRPTMALLGEFSAGKSTLANVLLGAAQSTVRVTATQAPPIWYVAGTGSPVLIDTDGVETEISSGSLTDVTLEGTRVVRVPVQADILEAVTLIDMPGSSDPNMSPDLWDALLPLADIAIWCTPATQAWRQSEAAIWDMVPEALRQRSLLLLTRMDKVTAPSDRSRIISRVEREIKGLFRAVLPVSLLNVRQPASHCVDSGMSQVMQAIKDILSGSSAESSAPDQSTPIRPTGEAKARPQIVPRRVSIGGSQPNARIIRRAGPQDSMT